MDLPDPPRQKARAASMIFILSIPFVFVVMVIRYKEMSYEVKLQKMIDELDSKNVNPEWDPHRLGFCMISTFPDTKHTYDAARHARRLYPSAPMHILSTHEKEGIHAIAHDMKSTLEFVEDIKLEDIVRCMRIAANETQIIALIDDHTWMYGHPPIIPDGLIGLVGHSRILHDPVCDTQHIHDSLVVSFGSVFLSHWVNTQITDEAVRVSRDMPHSLSHVVRCTDERVGADAKLVRDESEWTEFHDDAAFLYRDAH